MSSCESRARKQTPSEGSGRVLKVGLVASAVLAGLGLLVGSACAEPQGGSGAPGTGGASVRAADSRQVPPTPVRVARFDQPVEVKTAPGFDRLMFVLEQPGRVMVVARGRKLARPFLDLRRRVAYGGEQGLLSIAFPPDYRKTRKFYVYYTNRGGNIQVDEFRRKGPHRAAVGSRRAVMTIPHPYDNHNGGQMNFLGDLLYISTGDGGGGGDPEGNAQDRRSLLGKLLRIDPRRAGDRPWSVPGTNPFVGGAGRGPIFAYGLRNPFRWSFDLGNPARPRITIADVGQDSWEEVDSLTLEEARGANFGWSYFEGFEPYPGNGPRPVDPIRPIAVLGHSDYCSVTGGLVVRDPRLPSLEGRYLFADFCTERLLSLPGIPTGPTDPLQTAIRIPQVTSFAERTDRSVVVTSLNGSLYRLVPGR